MAATATLAALTTATVPTRGLWSAAVAATTTDVSTTATNVSTAKEEKQDYATAYSFLDADRITLYEHHLTQDAYVQKAKVLDVQEGKVTSYSFSEVGVEFSNGVNTANIIVNVTRKGVTYPVQVQLLQEPNGWKIISIDGI